MPNIIFPNADKNVVDALNSLPQINLVLTAHGRMTGDPDASLTDPADLDLIIDGCEVDYTGYASRPADPEGFEYDELEQIPEINSGYLLEAQKHGAVTLHVVTESDLPPIALPLIISDFRPTEAWA